MKMTAISRWLRFINGSPRKVSDGRKDYQKWEVTCLSVAHPSVYVVETVGAAFSNRAQRGNHTVAVVIFFASRAVYKKQALFMISGAALCSYFDATTRCAFRKVVR